MGINKEGGYPNQRGKNHKKKGAKNKGKKLDQPSRIRKRAVEPPFTTWPGGSDRA
jgi:hypothetical protein